MASSIALALNVSQSSSELLSLNRKLHCASVKKTKRNSLRTQASGADGQSGSSEAASAPGVKPRSSGSGCATCGRESVAGGCNGEGRIQGGIAVVPGFRWWPIKVYRPCPDFIKSGGVYKRQGQSLDEVAFGRSRKGDDKSIRERLEGKRE